MFRWTHPASKSRASATLDGDLTNIFYYSDVRVDDQYRLGDVNAGWTVLREPLHIEHGAVAAAPDGLQDTSIMMHQAGSMAAAVDKGSPRPPDRPTALAWRRSDGQHALNMSDMLRTCQPWFRFATCLTNLSRS